MKIEYSLKSGELIELPKSYAAYSFPDLKDVVSKSCIEHHFNELKRDHDSYEYVLEVFIDDLLKYQHKVFTCISLDAVE